MFQWLTHSKRTSNRAIMEESIRQEKGRLAEAVVKFEHRRSGVQVLAEETLKAISEGRRRNEAVQN